MSRQSYTYKPGDHKKKKKKRGSLLLPAIAVCALLLTVTVALRKHTVYSLYAYDVKSVPLMALAFQALNENIYPWTDTAQVLGTEDPDPSETAAGETEETQETGETDPSPETEAEETTQEMAEETETEAAAPDLPLTFTTVTDNYFADAVFLGDSRMDGLSLYCKALDEVTTFYAKPSLTIYTLLNKDFIPKPGGGKMNIEEALTLRQYGKVYIMVGINELGVGDPEYYKEHYAEVLDRIRELQPGAIYYICSAMHVTEKKSRTDKTVKNEKVDAWNAAVATLANGVDTFYLEMNEPVDDENGNLRNDLTGDGVHLKGSAYEPWHQYLLTHAIVRPGIDDVPGVLPLPEENTEETVPVDAPGEP